MSVKYVFNPFTNNLDVVPTATDNQIIFSDGGTLVGSANLTFDDGGTGLLSVLPVSGGINSKFGTATDYWKFETITIGADTYPMLSPVSSGAPLNTGVIKNGLIIVNQPTVSGYQTALDWFDVDTSVLATIYLSGAAPGTLITTSHFTSSGTITAEQLNSTDDADIAGTITVGDLVTDIGGLTILGGQAIQPSVDSTGSLFIKTAAGYNFARFDTTNKRLSLSNTAGGAIAPTNLLDIFAENAIGLRITRYGTAGAQFSSRSAAGTEALPTQVLLDSQVTGFGVAIYHSGGAFSTGGNPCFWAMFAGENHTATAQGTYHAWGNTARTTTSRRIGMVLSPKGTLFLGDSDNTPVIDTDFQEAYTVEGVSQFLKVIVDKTDAVDGYVGLRALSATAGRAQRMAFFRAGAASATVADTWTVGRIPFFGHDGTDYNWGATIEATVDGAVSGNTVPMGLSFLTSETNSGGLTQRLWIDPTGYLATLFNFRIDSDSSLLSLGAGQDMSVSYNGTVGRIDTSLVAASDLQIDCGTDKTIVLDETVFNDANVGGMTLRAGATTPPVTQWVDNLGANTGIYGLGFAALDEANGSIEIPHDYKEGTNIVFHVHWGANAAPTGTDYVKWQLTYYIDSEAGGATTVPATVIVIETAYATQYEHKRSDFPTITGTTFKIGDQINFNLKRIVAAGDAYAGVVMLETVGFHYEVDTLGSRQIATK